MKIIDDKPYLLWSLLYLLFSFVILPSELIHWDYIGHVDKAANLTNLFSWNTRFFLGYDEFISYPPLFTIIAGSLGKIIGVHSAVKTIVILSFSFIPFAFYKLFKTFYNKTHYPIAILLLSISIFYTRTNMGFGFHSTFNIGTIAAALNFIFFITGWTYFRKRSLLASFFWGLNLFGHFVFPLLILLILITHTLTNKKSIFENFRIGFLSFLIASWWLIPFIANSNFNVSPAGHFDPNKVMSTIFMLVPFIGVFFKQKTKLHIDLLLLSLPLSILFFLSIITTFYGKNLAFHPDRLYSLNLLISPIIAAPLLAKIVNKKVLLILNLLFILLLPTSDVDFLWQIKKTQTDNYEQIVTDSISKKQGRVLVIENFRQQTKQIEKHTFHSLKYKLSKKMDITSGLFLEASRNGPVVLLSKSSIVESFWEVMVWIDDSYIKPRLIEKENIEPIIKLLGVDQIIVHKSHHPEVMKHLNIILTKEVGDFYILELENQLIEAYSERIECINKARSNWYRYIMDDWLKAPNFLKARCNHNIEETAANELSYDQHNNSYLIKLKNKTPTNVIVKVSYSHYWKAFELNTNKELPIYELSPSIMLIPTNQDFKLKYSSTNLYFYVGFICTLIGLISLIVLMRLKKHKV